MRYGRELLLGRIRRYGLTLPGREVHLAPGAGCGVGPERFEQRDDVRMSIEGIRVKHPLCDRQCCPPRLICRVQVRSFAVQELHDFICAPMHGPVQRGVAVAVSGVHVIAESPR